MKKVKKVRKITSVILAVTLVASMLLLAACDDVADSDDAIDDKNKVGAEVSVKYYFANEDYLATGDDKNGKYVVTEGNVVKYEVESKFEGKNEQKEEMYEQVLESLAMANPPEGAVNCMSGDMIDDVIVNGDVVTIDFDDEDLHMLTGMLDESFVVGQIVNTLIDNFGVKQVNMLVDGVKKDTLNGHIDISEPFTKLIK